MSGPHTGSARLIDDNAHDQLRGIVTPQDWNKVEAAFHRALSLEADHRDTFVASFAAHEPELVSLLRALLAADADGDHRLFDELAMLAQTLLRRFRQRR